MAERHGGSIESCGCMSSRVAVMQRVCTKLQGPQALNVAYKEDTLRKMLRARVYDNWTRQKVDKARQFTRIVNPRSSNLTNNHCDACRHLCAMSNVPEDKKLRNWERRSGHGSFPVGQKS